MARLPSSEWADLRDDFERRDSVVFEFKEETEIDGAARKVAGEPAGDHDLAALPLTREGFAPVLIPGRGFRLPLLDGGTALIGVPLILYDGVLSEALRHRLAVNLVRSEVSGDCHG